MTMNRGLTVSRLDPRHHNFWNYLPEWTAFQAVSIDSSDNAVGFLIPRISFRIGDGSVTVEICL